jgi:hypothetical protein
LGYGRGAAQHAGEDGEGEAEQPRPSQPTLAPEGDLVEEGRLAEAVHGHQRRPVLDGQPHEPSPFCSPQQLNIINNIILNVYIVFIFIIFVIYYLF